MLLGNNAHEALTSCCMHMISRAYFWNRQASGKTPQDAIGQRDDAAFVPSEQQERSAEHHFAQLRSMYSNRQLTVRDYIEASANLARSSLRQLTDGHAVRSQGWSLSLVKSYFSVMFIHISRMVDWLSA